MVGLTTIDVSVQFLHAMNQFLRSVAYVKQLDFSVKSMEQTAYLLEQIHIPSTLKAIGAFVLPTSDSSHFLHTVRLLASRNVNCHMRFKVNLVDATKPFKRSIR